MHVGGAGAPLRVGSGRFSLQALLELEMNSDLKAQLRELNITAAKVTGGFMPGVGVGVVVGGPSAGRGGGICLAPSRAPRAGAAMRVGGLPRVVLKVAQCVGRRTVGQRPGRSGRPRSLVLEGAPRRESLRLGLLNRGMLAARTTRFLPACFRGFSAAAFTGLLSRLPVWTPCRGKFTFSNSRL